MRQYITPPLFATPLPSIDFICIPIAHLLIRDATCHPVQNLGKVIYLGIMMMMMMFIYVQRVANGSLLYDLPRGMGTC